MKFLFKLIYRVAVILVVLILVAGFYRTWKMNNSTDQKIFTDSEALNPLPSGYYSLSIGDYSGFWKAKIFDSAHEQGINVLYRWSKDEDRYPFRTYLSKGIHEPDLEVLKVDYNVTGNSFWLKPFLEEIVKTGEGEYLGKMSYQFLPGFPFALGFYKLQEGEKKIEL